MENKRPFRVSAFALFGAFVILLNLMNIYKVERLGRVCTEIEQGYVVKKLGFICVVDDCCNSGRLSSDGSHRRITTDLSLRYRVYDPIPIHINPDNGLEFYAGSKPVSAGKIAVGTAGAAALFIMTFVSNVKRAKKKENDISE